MLQIGDGHQFHGRRATAMQRWPWPEPWEVIYEKGYTLAVTAEAQPLLFGGYGVAKIIKVERIDKEPPDAPPKWKAPSKKPETKEPEVKRWKPKT